MMCKLVIVALAALAAGMGGGAAAQSTAGKSANATLNDVLVQFTFKARGEYAHLFLADKLGYYRREGLKVEFREGVGSGPVFASVATKPTGNTMIIAVMNAAAVAIHRGLPLQAVATWQPVVQSVLVARRGVALKSPKDLIGKTVGLKQGQNAELVFPHFLKTNGIDPRQVSLRTLDASSANAVFLKGLVDVVDAFATNEVPTLEAQVGGRLNVLWFADFGFPDLGIGVVVRRDLATTKAGENVIRGFLNASAKGIAAMKENPQAAAEAIKAKYGALLPETPVVLEQVKATIASMPQVGNHPYGWTEPSAWDDAIATAKKTGVIVDQPGKAPIPVSEFFTNKFLK